MEKLCFFQEDCVFLKLFYLLLNNLIVSHFDFSKRSNEIYYQPALQSELLNTLQPDRATTKKETNTSTYFLSEISLKYFFILPT